ncbi:MAG: ABC transporter transmembrane domain-containing protein [Gemmiger sp.]
MTGADKTADPRALYARLRRARGHAPLYALCTGVYALALFLIFSSVGVLLRSVLLLAQGQPGGEPGRLALYLGLISAFAVLAGFTGLGFAWLEQRTQNTLRRRMLHSLLHAREDAAAALPAGDLLARFTTDLSEAVDLVGFYLAGWIWAPILSGALSLAWLLAVDWVVAALCAGCALGNYAVMRGFSGRLQALSGQITAGQAAVTQLVDEGIRGRQEVRSYRLGPMLQRRLDAALTALAGAVNRRTALLARRRSLNSLFGGVGVYLAVLLGGAALAGAGRVNFADVIVALPLSDQISQMFTALGHLGPMLAQRTPQAARVFAVIDLPGEEDGRAGAPRRGPANPNARSPPSAPGRTPSSFPM